MQKTEQLTLDLGREYTLPPLRKAKGYRGLAAFHKYWGKKPVEVWNFLIEHLTIEGDVVLDPFLGSGLVARESVKLSRPFIGFDINPFSIELAKFYVVLTEYEELKKAIEEIKRNLMPDIEDLYKLSTGEIASHFLWEKNKITRVWTKKRNKRTEISLSNDEIHFLEIEAKKRIDTEISLNFFNNSRINSHTDISVNDLFSARAILLIEKLQSSFEKYPDNISTSLQFILTASLGQMSNMVFAITRRGKTKGIERERTEVGSWVIGYWQPKKHFEINAWNCFENKAKKLLKAIKHIEQLQEINLVPSMKNFGDSYQDIYLKTGDSERLLAEIPSDTIKLIVTDPPHGDRIPYLELSEMWNAFLGFQADFENELVVSNAKGRGKGINEYNEKFSSILNECVRVLDKNGVLAIIFNARGIDSWKSLEKLDKIKDLEYLGHYPMEYSAGSVVQDNRKGSLKSDYVLLYGKKITKQYKKNTLAVLSSSKFWDEKYPIKEKY